MKDLSPPSTKTPLTDPGEQELNHIWQRWFSDLYNYLKKRDAVTVSNSAPGDSNADLQDHIAKTGTAVHGLGTASTHDATDFDPAGAADAVAVDLQEFEDYAIMELKNRVILFDPIPPEDTLLVKSADLSDKIYERLDLTDGLIVKQTDTGKALGNEYGDLLEQLREWTMLFPLPSIGRRLMSPLGAPLSNGKIYPRS